MEMMRQTIQTGKKEPITSIGGCSPTAGAQETDSAETERACGCSVHCGRPS